MPSETGWVAAVALAGLLLQLLTFFCVMRIIGARLFQGRKKDCAKSSLTMIINSSFQE